MARSGVYKSDVKRARDALVAQGRNPSLDAVRIELGNTGSKTTIHKYLKELEAEGRGAGAVRMTISETLQGLVEQLSAQLLAEADDRIASMRAEFDTRMEERNSSLLATMQENSKLLTSVRNLEGQVGQQGAALADVRAALQGESTARQVAEQQVADLKERLAENEVHRLSLEEKHQNARDSLEHYRQSMKEQREADERRHEQQVQQLQAELRKAQQTVSVKQEEVTRLNQEGARLVSDVAHARQLLLAEEDKVKRHLREIEDLRAVATRCEILAVQVKDRDAHLSQLVGQLETARRDATEAKMEGAAQQREASVLTKELHKVQSLAGQLEIEKQNWIRERAELEEQLAGRQQ